MRVTELSGLIQVTGDPTDVAAVEKLTSSAKNLPAYAGSLDAATIRQSAMKLADSSETFQVPAQVEREWLSAGKVRCCWFSRAADRDKAPILYLHGGGYVGGSVESSRGIAACLALAHAAPILAVEYRQGPEHPYPAAINDTRDAYDWLSAQTQLPVTLAGDSAGGALAVGMAVEAARTGRRLARAAIAMSGWFDLSTQGESWLLNAGKDIISAKMGEFFRDSYVQGADLKKVNDFVFEQLEKAPPMLIQMGGFESVLDSAFAFVMHARAMSVPVQLEVYQRMVHNFGKFDSAISTTMFRRGAAWLRSHP